jgi:hypothetical protein
MDAKANDRTGRGRLPAEIDGERPHDVRSATSIPGYGTAPESPGIADLDEESATVALQHVHSNVAGLSVDVGVLNGIRARLDDGQKDGLLQRSFDSSCTQPGSHRCAEMTELFAPRRKPFVEPLRWLRFEPKHQHRDVVISRLLDAQPGDERSADVRDREISQSPSRIGKPAQADIDPFPAAFDEPIGVQHEQRPRFE